MKMKNRVSMNKKVITRLILVAILFGIAIIAIFYGSERQSIRQKSREAIETSLVNGETENTNLPSAYYIYTDELGTGVLIDTEEMLGNAYLKNRKAYASGKIAEYSEGGTLIYFMPLEAARVTEFYNSKDSTVLIYCDVTFAANVAKNTMLVLAVLLGCMAAALILIGNYAGKQLDRKDQGMKDFFANASHELKTPLMAIRTNADGIREGYIETEKGCGVIAHESERMGTLIGQILDLSKVDSGAYVMHPARTDLREVLYDALEAVEAEAGQKGICLDVCLPEPVMYTCDEDMMYSAFSNVLSNAVRYAATRISVSVEKENDTGKGGAVRFLISNDGKVMSEEDREHLFERFYRGERGQTGIGMALAKEYVAMHKGNISVSDDSGRTVFRIELP